MVNVLDCYEQQDNPGVYNFFVEPSEEIYYSFVFHYQEYTYRIISATPWPSSEQLSGIYNGIRYGVRFAARRIN